MAMAIPLLMAGGSVAQGISQKNADDQNAATYRQEGAVGAAQGYAAEATQRQRGSEIIDDKIAAAGQAGAGYGGSVGRSISQSALRAEQDDLNIRYKAGLQKWSYLTQARNLNNEGTDAEGAGFLRAGSALLQGSSRSYVGSSLG